MNLNNKYFIAVTIFIFILCSTVLVGQADLESQKLSINFENLTIIQAIEKIEKETGIKTAYNEREFGKTKINKIFENETASNILNAILSSENFSYKIIGDTVTIFRDKKNKENEVPQKNINRYTVSGYLMDETSNETLIGASIFCKQTGQGTSTNEYGFYSITLPEGVYDFVYSYVGYGSSTENITLESNIEITKGLNVGAQLTEIVVTDDQQKFRHTETKMSSNTISLEKIKSMPVLMGESDVLKVIQLLPGVQSGTEGSTGLYIRGGGPDQNLMLLDGVPVYNASHLFGFLSTFNGDAIKSVELIKGGFPARHGGRLSSIIDVRMKEGNMKKFAGDITVGLISGRINLEGPIVKDKTSFSVSGRRTWLDLFATPIQKSINKSAQPTDEKILTKYSLYDINFKVNHKFSDKSRLYLSSYLGHDNLEHNAENSFFKETGGMEWGNRLATVRWNYQFNPKLFSNTTVYQSTYDFQFNNKYIEAPNSNFPITEVFSSKSNIKDYGAKFDINYIPHQRHYIRTGIKYGIYKFSPTTTFLEVQEGTSTPNSNTNGSVDVDGQELNAYLEDDITVSNKLKINVGLHYATFNVQNTTYHSFQPRAALSYLLTKNSSLKISATKMTQFLHLLTSPGLGLPTDLWVASTAKIKPENSWQYGLAYTKSLGKGFEMTVEGFYKDMDNLLEYRSGFNFFSNSQDWENKVNSGDGESYGLELLLEKTTGKTTGWIGYTLSKSDRSFPDINNGKPFPYKYDRRHDIGLAVTHKKSDRLDFGLVWIYGTGNTYTLGTTNYNAFGIHSNIASSNTLNTLGTTNHIENRNNQRMPAYHRMDVSINLHKVKKRGIRTWSFGIYNIYARQNPFVVYNSFNREGTPVLKQQSLIPILPYFSYSFKF